MAAAEAQLLIRHLALQGVIPGESGSSDTDLARIAADKLGLALREALAPLDAGGEQLVFVRKLTGEGLHGNDDAGGKNGLVARVEAAPLSRQGPPRRTIA